MEGTEIFERAAELEAVDDALSRVAAGDGGVVALAGTAGSGRSALLRATRERARERGLRALRASGSVLEQGFRFGVTRQLLEVAARSTGGAAGLAERIAAVDDGGDTPLAALQALFGLTADLAADGPVVLCVDDMQWADDCSLQFLDYLVRRIDDLAVLLVFAPWPVGRELPGGRLSSLGSSSITRVLTPRPLSREATARMVARVLAAEPEPRFTAACHAMTDGNPFLLHELLRSAADRGVRPVDGDAGLLSELAPHTIGHSVLSRLGDRSPTVVRLAFALAVLSDGAEQWQAAEVAGLDAAEAAAATAVLTDLAMLRTGSRVAFRQPVVRRALYRLLSTEERSRAHARAARVFAGEGSDPSAVATHLLATDAGGDPWVAETLADAARRIGDPTRVAELLRRALDEPAPKDWRPWLLRDLGRAELQAGDPAARHHLEAALELTTSRVARVEVGIDVARAMAREGRSIEALRLLDDLGHRAGGADELPEELWERVRITQVVVASWRADMRAGLRRLAITTGPEDRPAVRLMAHGYAVLGELLGASGALRESTVAQMQALVAGGELLAHYGGVHLHGMLGGLLVFAERPDEAEREVDVALDHAVRSGDVVATAAVRNVRTALRLRVGRLEAAEEDGRYAMEIAARSWPLGAQGVAANLVEVLVERDRLDDADAVLARGGWTGALPGGSRYTLLLFSRGRLRLAQGRLAEAQQDLDAHAGRLVEEGMTGPITSWRSWAALVSSELGQSDRAAALVEEELAAPHTPPGSRARGIALRTAGLLTDDVERALALVEEAERCFTIGTGQLELARTAVDHGIVLARAGYRARARERLLAGAEAAAQCGATALQVRGRAALQGLGVRPEAVGGLSALLTGGERRVAELAAEGHSNREIGELLFVTTKTVEWHLTHVYRKLGISNRSALREALAVPFGRDQGRRPVDGPGAWLRPIGLR